MIKKAFKGLAVSYLTIIAVLGILAAIIPETERNKERIESGEPAIYYYDALVIGIRCENTFWDGGIEFLLNYPLWMVYAPIFSFVSTTSCGMAVHHFLEMSLTKWGILKHEFLPGWDFDEGDLEYTLDEAYAVASDKSLRIRAKSDSLAGYGVAARHRMARGSRPVCMSLVTNWPVWA